MLEETLKIANKEIMKLFLSNTAESKEMTKEDIFLHVSKFVELSDLYVTSLVKAQIDGAMLGLEQSS